MTSNTAPFALAARPASLRAPTEPRHVVTSCYYCCVEFCDTSCTPRKLQ